MSNKLSRLLAHGATVAQAADPAGDPLSLERLFMLSDLGETTDKIFSPEDTIIDHALPANPPAASSGAVATTLTVELSPLDVAPADGVVPAAVHTPSPVSVMPEGDAMPVAERARGNGSDIPHAATSEPPATAPEHPAPAATNVVDSMDGRPSEFSHAAASEPTAAAPEHPTHVATNVPEMNVGDVEKPNPVDFHEPAGSTDPSLDSVTAGHTPATPDGTTATDDFGTTDDTLVAQHPDGTPDGTEAPDGGNDTPAPDDGDAPTVTGGDGTIGIFPTQAPDNPQSGTDPSVGDNPDLIPDGASGTVGSFDGWTSASGEIKLWHQVTDDGSDTYQIELDAGHGVDTLEHAIQTDAGQNYKLTFDIADRPDGHGTNTVDIYWNGELVQSVNPDDDGRTEVSVDLVGTGGLDKLVLAERADENDGYGALLDGFRFTPDHGSDDGNNNNDGTPPTDDPGQDTNGNSSGDGPSDPQSGTDPSVGDNPDLIPDGASGTVGSFDGWTSASGEIKLWHQVTDDGSDTYQIELDAGHGVDTLERAIQTDAGQNYKLTFNIADRPDGHGTNTVDIYWNGELVQSVNPDDDGRTEVSVDLVGTGGLDKLVLAERADENDGYGALLDGFRFTPDHGSDDGNNNNDGTPPTDDPGQDTNGNSSGDGPSDPQSGTDPSVGDNPDLIPDGASGTVGSFDGWTSASGEIKLWHQVTDDGSDTYQIELDAGHGVDTLEHAIQTDAGQNYKLTFDIADRPDGHGTNTVDIYWNGELVQSVNPDDDGRTEVSVDLVGTGGLDKLVLAERADENDGYGALLDGFRFTPDHGSDDGNNNNDGTPPTDDPGQDTNGNSSGDGPSDPQSGTDDSDNANGGSPADGGSDPASGANPNDPVDGNGATWLDDFLLPNFDIRDVTGPDGHAGQAVNLDASSDVDGMYASYGFTPGQQIAIEFDAALQQGADEQNNPTSAVSVTWNGELVADFTPQSADWEHHRIIVTADDFNDLEFGEHEDQNDGIGALLMNVKVTALAVQGH